MLRVADRHRVCAKLSLCNREQHMLLQLAGVTVATFVCSGLNSTISCAIMCGLRSDFVRLYERRVASGFESEVCASADTA